MFAPTTSGHSLGSVGLLDERGYFVKVITSGSRPGKYIQIFSPALIIGNLSFLASIKITPVEVAARTVKLGLVMFSVFDGFEISKAVHLRFAIILPTTGVPEAAVDELLLDVPELELPESKVHEHLDENALSDNRIVM